MPILEVRQLKKYFPVNQGVFLRRKGWVYAVDDVSFSVNKGETLGVVGESGCGKTTLGRCIMGLYDLTEGDIKIHSKSVASMKKKEKKKLSLEIQMIFQDPFESLNARQTVNQILKEKFIIHQKKDADTRIEIKRLLEMVGLSQDDLSKFPHEFSGGQRQRIGIARAISLNPEIIICDEPVSALDVSVQSKILNLLLELQKKLELTYVFISHDLSVVKHISDKIAVMYLGKIVEIADTAQIYENPRHPYTIALLSAIPIPDPDSEKKRILLSGEVPSVENPPMGCRFHTRCLYAQSICSIKEPALEKKDMDSGHMAACHFDDLIL